MNTARASRDINDVTALTITGWRGAYRVEKHAPIAPGMSILAPRHEGEYWTFRPRIDIPAVTQGDVIRIVPKAGPERMMRVAHAEHHIITLTEISASKEAER